MDKASVWVVEEQLGGTWWPTRADLITAHSRDKARAEWAAEALQRMNPGGKFRAVKYVREQP